MADRILFSWSGGKDSALALYSLKHNNCDIQISALLTTVTADYDRISMHGVRRELLEKQAESIGFPLEKVIISKKSSNEEYEEKIKEILLRYKNEGVSAVAFGDIFLEDLKKYREENLAKIGLKGIFPLWKQNSYILAKKFIDLNFKAIITCVDGAQLDQSFCGREFDDSFLSQLPKDVDPCGENGEFHSFVYAGPIFREKICFDKGEIVRRDERFYFCDLKFIH
ncbi:MAG: diphthine--ammonia ligase [Chitinispirillaceae bacterium]|jgi:uncharacterized protein (TIGR00290 family)